MNLQQYDLNKKPYLIYNFYNCFNRNTIYEINHIISELDKNINSENYNGKRQNGNLRYFLDKNNCKNYPSVEKCIEFLIRKDTVNHIEDLGNVSLKNCYLSFEIILDKQNFWLDKNVDSVEKKMSFLIFINDNGEDINNGPDIYNQDLRLFNTIPFIHNSGCMFFPNKITWYGLEKGKNIRYRKLVIINYVTFKTNWKINY